MAVVPRGYILHDNSFEPPKSKHPPPPPPPPSRKGWCVDLNKSQNRAGKGKMLSLTCTYFQIPFTGRDKHRACHQSNQGEQVQATLCSGPWKRHQTEEVLPVLRQHCSQWRLVNSGGIWQVLQGILCTWCGLSSCVNQLLWFLCSICVWELAHQQGEAIGTLVCQFSEINWLVHTYWTGIKGEWNSSFFVRQIQWMHQNYKNITVKLWAFLYKLLKSYDFSTNSTNRCDVT